jgi:hypothetical protein
VATTTMAAIVRSATIPPAAIKRRGRRAFMMRQAGIEPATSRSGGARSIP